MTQENKEPLLLRYLCAILPYRVIVSCAEGTVMGIHWNKVKLDVSLLFELQENGALSYVKPYLRSMDSMNEEEVIEFNNIPSTKNYQIVKGDLPWDVANYKQIDWLLKNHFDFMGLIPMGLAIEVTEENNPYEN